MKFDCGPKVRILGGPTTQAMQTWSALASHMCFMRNLLGWLGTRLAQLYFNYISIAQTTSNYLIER